MDAVLTNAFLTSLVAGSIAAGIPLLLAGLGEAISEKAGVLNIGLEGMMLMGAYGGFLAALSTGSETLGFFAGAFGGTLLAGVMALLCVSLRMNQIVVGIALTLFAEGFTALLHLAQFSRTYPRLDAAWTVHIPGLSEVPVIGHSVFQLNPMAYIAFALVAGTAWLFNSTSIGLNLKSAGDKPAALDAAGVSVTWTRVWAVLATGALAGVGGAYMAIVAAGIFVPFMTNGGGFIAIVLAMLAQGRPTWVLGGALLFGLALSLTAALQIAGVQVPTDAVQMLPFILVMVVLVAFARRTYLPAFLALPYERGER